MRRSETLDAATLARDQRATAWLAVLIHILRRFTPYLFPYWHIVLFRVLCALVQAALGVFTVVAVTNVVDRGLHVHDAREFFFWALAGTALQATNLVLTGIYHVLVSYVNVRIDLKMKCTMLDHVQRMALRLHLSRPVGENMFRITRDTSLAVRFVPNFIPECVERILSIGTTAGLLFLLQPSIASMVVVYMTIYCVCTHYIYGYAFRKNTELLAAGQSVLSILQENLAGYAISKGFARERHEVRRVFNRMADYARANIPFYISTNLWWQFSEFAFFFFNATAYTIYCGGLAIRGVLTMGEFVALPALIGQVTNPIQALIVSIQELRVASVPVQRMLETLDLAPDVPANANACRMEAPAGRIEFEHVYFRYTPDGPDVIRDLSFRLEPGRKLAFVGVSGAGKSSAFNLLMRFCDPSRGRVLIDGVDLREWDLTSYREHVSIVLQDNFLYSASVRDNILFGSIRASERQLEDVVERAGLRQTIEALPQGLETILAEGGNLSMGQKQRIAIARALIRDPKFLFLDEATSSLDPVMEQEILDQLATIEKGRTCIVIAHHIASVETADEILVMEDGVCVQRGAHDALMANEGPYRRLWTFSFGDPEKNLVERQPGHAPEIATENGKDYMACSMVSTVPSPTPASHDLDGILVQPLHWDDADPGMEERVTRKATPNGRTAD